MHVLAVFCCLLLSVYAACMWSKSSVSIFLAYAAWKWLLSTVVCYRCAPLSSALVVCLGSNAAVKNANLLLWILRFPSFCAHNVAAIALLYPGQLLMHKACVLCDGKVCCCMYVCVCEAFYQTLSRFYAMELIHRIGQFPTYIPHTYILHIPHIHTHHMQVHNRKSASPFSQHGWYSCNHNFRKTECDK
jgi:hypothetical protein